MGEVVSIKGFRAGREKKAQYEKEAAEKKPIKPIRAQAKDAMKFRRKAARGSNGSRETVKEFLDRGGRINHLKSLYAGEETAKTERIRWEKLFPEESRAGRSTLG